MVDARCEYDDCARELSPGVEVELVETVIAVDTGSSYLVRREDIARHGFTAIYMRAATTMMHALQLHPLERWTGPPMILIRPRVSHISWFSFTRADELMEAARIDGAGQDIVDADLQRLHRLVPLVEVGPTCDDPAPQCDSFDLTISLPQGYTDPIVFCGFTESPGGGVQHPSLQTATGGVVSGSGWNARGGPRCSGSGRWHCRSASRPATTPRPSTPGGGLPWR